MTNILFVVNPISGDKDKEELLSKVHSWANSSDQQIETWKTTGEDDSAKLKEQIDQHQPDSIVAIGGDGTLMLCADLLKHTGTPLGLIPGGSANGMATELGIPEDVDEALKIIGAGHSIDADMLSFNGGEDHGLHISDVGMNANLVQEFEEGERRGFLGYAQGVISQLKNPEQFQARLLLDQKEIKASCYMVAFANASRYGTGALLTKEGKLDDGLFEVYVLKELNLAGIAGQFLDILPEDQEYFDVYQVSTAEVILDQPQSFQIDGELKPETSSVSVEVVPGCLKLIVPGE